jgi:multidrug resistance efflux pump
VKEQFGVRPAVENPENLKSKVSASLTERVRSLRLPQQSEVHSGRRHWVPWLLCAVFAATTAWLAVQVSRESAGDTTKAAAKLVQNESPTVSAASDPVPVAASGDVCLESKGYVIPVHQIQVSPKVSGMVIKLRFEEGQRVQKGDVLAELEPVDYVTDRDRCKGLLDAARQRLLELQRGNRPEEIEAAKADLAESEANRQQLYLEWKRNVNLRNSNAVAARDYEQAYGAFKAMDRHVERLRQNLRLMIEGPRKEKVDAAKSEVAQAEADLAKGEWRLENCTVRAPISGTILTKYAEEGNIVNQMALNLKGSLCDMADLSDLEVDLNIQERDIAKVFKGQRCHVRPEAFPDRSYEGTVSRLMPIADRAKGAVPVRVKIVVPKEEEGIYLKPEMGAIVSFLKKQTVGGIN